MKKILLCTVLATLLAGCKTRDKIFEYAESENWEEYYAGDTTTLRQAYKVYSQGKDTWAYFTNYYPNGKLKSKVTMKNDLLWEIECVLDSLGNQKNFGSLKNGNGYVIEYTDDTGQPEKKGRYVNGNKEGWWKNYHGTGSIKDSTHFKEGVIISPLPNEATLTDLLEITRSRLQNNYYR